MEDSTFGSLWRAAIEEEEATMFDEQKLKSQGVFLSDDDVLVLLNLMRNTSTLSASSAYLFISFICLLFVTGAVMAS